MCRTEPRDPSKALRSTAQEEAATQRLAGDIERVIAHLERRTGTRGEYHAEVFAMERMNGEHDFGYREDDDGGGE